MKNEFEQTLKSEIERIKSLVKYAEDNNLTDEQYYLSFEDSINCLSIKNHDNKQLNDNKN